MPVRQMPVSFKATRKLNLKGTAVASGAVLSAAVVLGLLGQRVGAYVSRGWLVPTPPLYPQRARRSNPVRPAQEYSLSPTEVRSLL